MGLKHGCPTLVGPVLIRVSIRMLTESPGGTEAQLSLCHFPFLPLSSSFLDNLQSKLPHPGLWLGLCFWWKSRLKTLSSMENASFSTTENKNLIISLRVRKGSPPTESLGKIFPRGLELGLGYRPIFLHPPNSQSLVTMFLLCFYESHLYLNSTG